MERPAHTSPLQDELRCDIELVFRVYRDLMLETDRHLRDLDLGRMHYQLLLCIARHPRRTVRQHLPLMNLTKQAMSRLIKDLLAQGLIEEQAGVRDRRERYLILTAEGVELERKLTDAHGARFQRIYEQSGPEAIARFRDIMGLLLGGSSRIEAEHRPATPLPEAGESAERP